MSGGQTGSDDGGARGDGPRGDAQKPHATLSDVAKAHRFADMRSLLKTEACAREGFVYGMGVGATVAVLRIFKGRGLINAGNWGVAAFAVVAVVGKKLCHYQHAHQSAKLRTLLEMQTKEAPKVKGFRHAKTDGEESSSHSSSRA
ncbi:hypothetical protein GGI04_000998 [Coemansia thaxteri]|nr:hypothetical protein GGI04_000998 [Coemansia thaxteri]KAJ2472895.1 hypothetical protein GGI02_001250 [Coemansia sp. RSA 2322]